MPQTRVDALIQVKLFSGESSFSVDLSSDPFFISFPPQVSPSPALSKDFSLSRPTPTALLVEATLNDNFGNTYSLVQNFSINRSVISVSMTAPARQDSETLVSIQLFY